MTISKLNRKDRFSESVRGKWKTTKERLDANPRRTAVWMAVILFVAFCMCIIRLTYNMQRSEEKSVDIIHTLQQRFFDSAQKSVTDDVTEYFELLEIQRELDEMQKHPEKRDSARIEQLIDKLNK